MNIYKILEQCLNTSQSLKIVIVNKYTNYSFQLLYYEENYYLFLNSKPIDVISFFSYILSFEIGIANDNNLYSDIYLNYELNNANKQIINETNAFKISSKEIILKLKEYYQKFCKFNNIYRFQNIFKIEDSQQKLYLFLKSPLIDTSMPIVCNTFFSLLANKINENFYQNRQNLIELFTEALLDNKDLNVYFNFKGFNYHVKFSFTDANNLEATIENFNQIFIGTEAFALLYIISVFYNEDYENSFIIEKTQGKKKRTNHQLLLNAYLLNELINQNKNNSKMLIETVHNYYKEKGLIPANLLFLVKNIKKVINDDSEFQDYSEDKKTVQTWLKRNASSLLDSNHATYSKDKNLSTNNATLKRNLTPKPKLIYWPNNSK